MDSNRWQQIERLVEAALQVPAAERSAWLADQCNGEESLRDEVTSLLAFADDSENFLRQPAASQAAHMLLADEDGSSRQGQSIGHYKVVREIGRGGMGVVFLAVRDDDQFKKSVAIKLLRRGMDTEDILLRFRNERQILASLEHPNIARLIDGGMTDDSLPYFVLEYVEGDPLGKYCDEHKLATAQRLQLFRKVCAAVQYAHQNLIVHRDLKPSNILVTSEGEPKLLDFGIAKLIDPELSEGNPAHTATSMRLMTPDYASPEQVRGQHVTTATDIYSLGVVLYELLSGVRPYKLKDSSPEGLSRAICESEPSKPSGSMSRRGQRAKGKGPSAEPGVLAVGKREKEKPPSIIRNPKSLRGDIDNIVLMALRKEPQRRYASAAEFSADIQRHLDGLPVIARKDTFKYRATKFVQRNRVGVAAVVLVFMTLLAAVVMTVREKRKADRRFNDGRQMANALIFEVDDEIQKGPTKARAMLAKRALEYLDSLARETGNESGLRLELAAGYLKVGDIQGKPYRPNLGDSAGALASYRKAEAILESLTAAAPTNLEARRYLSLSYQSIGRMQLRSGDSNAALEAVRKAVGIGEALVNLNPSAQYRHLLAGNYLHFGEALYRPERGATEADHKLAIEYFRKALAIHAALSAAEPDNAEYRYGLGVDYEFVGIAFNKLGDLTGNHENYRLALENHLKEFEINQALVASDPTNAAYRRILADVYGELRLSYLKLGRPTEALQNFQHKLAIFESVRTSDPTNIEARRDVAYAYSEIGQALAEVGKLVEALTQQNKAVAILQALHQAEPANIETRKNLQSSMEATGEIQKKIGDYAAAIETYQAALALIESWTGTALVGEQVQRQVAIVAAKIARVHEAAAVDPKSSRDRQADWRAAQEWFSRSLSAWHELRAQGLLNEADSIKLTELPNEIAKCKAALIRTQEAGAGSRSRKQERRFV